MSKTLYNENKIWQIQIVALVDARTVPEVPGPLGEHSISKTTIYFWPVPCAPLCSLCFSTFSPKLPAPFSKHLSKNPPNQKKHKKDENVKNVLKNVEKVIQIPKKGHRLGCWGWETWLLLCLGLPRAWNKIFFFTFFHVLEISW